ncbi:MAG TPA: host attachment protein [Ramlibacter sp.]|nr:host attachment protein [Ramlibacter sp.]
MKPDWILIADASRARLLQQAQDSPIIQLRAFEHRDSRLHSSELGDGERGRERSDRLFGASAYEARIEPQRKEHLRFARELAELLEEGARHGRCRSVRLFAPSPFLGELKAQLGDATQRLLAGSHDFDLSSVGIAEIGQRIQLAVAPGE